MGLAEVRRARQGQATIVDSVGHLTSKTLGRAVGGLLMDRWPETPGLDTAEGERGDELVRLGLILVNEQRIQPERGIRLQGVGSGVDKLPDEASVVSARDGPLRADLGVQTLELGQPDRRRDVVQPIVVADRVVVIVQAVDLGPGRQVPRVARELWAGGDDHPATAGCDGLVPVEREAPDIADGTDSAPGGGSSDPYGAECFRGVFDDADAELGAELEQWLHVCGMSESVHDLDYVGESLAAARVG